MPQALCFNAVSLDVITHNLQPWVRGSQITTALQYSSVQRVIEIYTRHADEFTDAMTAVVTLPTEGGPQETRIFSLRGGHLIAMFARPPVAKQFRRWVLEVLSWNGKSPPASARPLAPAFPNCPRPASAPSSSACTSPNGKSSA